MTAIALLNPTPVTAAGTRQTAVLQSLPPPHRALVTEALSLPITYMPNSLFTQPSAERELFDDGRTFTAASTAWYHLASKSGNRGDSRVAAPNAPHAGRLSAAEERQLFLRYNFARLRAASAVAHFRARPSRTLAQSVALWYARVKDTRDLIARANLALVLAMAKRIRGRRVEFGDLISEGNMALLRAIDAFDVNRGFKFSTYACRAIFKAYGRLILRAGRYLSMFPTRFEPALESSDYQETRRAHDQQDAVAELRQILLNNRAKLSPAEQTVLSTRFALQAGATACAMTLEEVGKVMGVTKECVRQIQNKALAKLKAALELDARAP